MLPSQVSDKMNIHIQTIFRSNRTVIFHYVDKIIFPPVASP